MSFPSLAKISDLSPERLAKLPRAKALCDAHIAYRQTNPPVYRVINRVRNYKGETLTAQFEEIDKCTFNNKSKFKIFVKSFSLSAQKQFAKLRRFLCK